jgi:hypothetical protein
MAKRPRIGDVFEIPLTHGYGYGQFVLNHREKPVYGPLIRVFEGVFCARPSDLVALANQREQFLTFFPLGAAVARGIVTIVCAAPIPDRLSQFPLFKVYGGINHETRKATSWYLWDGNQTWRVDQLTAEQRPLPVKEIINDTLLIERIETGWRPEADPML